MAFWVEFESRVPGTKHEGRLAGCIDPGFGEEPAAVAATFGVVKTMARIPYPAEPLLHAGTGCPPFCFSPEQCQGRFACPRERACSE